MHDSIDRANDMTRLWFDCTLMATDVPFVVAMRMMGMTGVWSVPDNEHHDMIREKAPVFTEALVSSTLTAIAGRGPDRVMQAAIEPISRKTRDNRLRLARRGPRLPSAPFAPPLSYESL